MRSHLALLVAAAVLLTAGLALVARGLPAGERATSTGAAVDPVDAPAVDADDPAANGPLDDLLALPVAGPPIAPDDPSALAAILVAAEGAIRDPARRPETLEAAGHWQQVVYRKLGNEPGLVDPTLAEVPVALHPAVRGNLFAGARLAAMHTPADPAEPPTVRKLPAWRIVPPPPADELKSYYHEAELATDVPWTYLAAVNLVETRMGRIRGDSVAGAQGPMQFMPATWAEWGEGSVHDHRDAILAA
ncbi:MAG TPA: hypothetical protein VM324_12445, partial [Egibacteraceae bacterium]|nr:hypothetical protein [Egibacteraceae bacterium]